MSVSSFVAVALSKKASSLVVAASMSAVEALKDQAGLCRWDYALRALYNRATAANKVGLAVPVSLSSSTQSAGGSATASAPAAAGRAARARPRRSEEEKLHKAHHLVCWGPN